MMVEWQLRSNSYYNSDYDYVRKEKDVQNYAIG